MPSYKRRTFLQQLIFLSAGLHPLYKALSKMPGPLRNFIEAKDSFIVDLHCHPNMKNYLLNDHMYRFHFSFPGENRITMQTDTHHLSQGNVKGFLAAHHIPERGVTEQSLGYRKLFRIVKRFAPEFASKVERGDSSNFRQLTTMLDDFEWHVEKTNKKLGGNFIKICKSYKDFEDAIQNNQIAVAQAIEGAHCIGRDCTQQQVLDRINFLADRGLSLMTISHFFENDFSFPVEGIPPSDKKKMKIHWRYNPAYDDRGLTDMGRVLIKQMLTRGVIVDLTHMTPKGRADVFDLNDAYANENHVAKRPVIFTHGGVDSTYLPSSFHDYKYMGASEEEIRRIKDCNGVIGIVFMNFWLKGMDKHTHPDHRRKEFKNGIRFVLETIDQIYSYTGKNGEYAKNYDHIAIGSDFDGFADAPNDLQNPKFFPRLIQAMWDHGIASDDIAKITHGNALRVLKEGWAK